MFRPWLLASSIALVAQAPAVAAPAAPALGPVVSAIAFEGEVSDTERLLVLATVKVGRPVTPAAIRETLSDFYQKGLWSAITVDETPAPDGTVALTFHFTAQLLLETWEFKGNRSLSDTVLARALDLDWGEPINPRAFAGYVDLIRERYVREGFFDARATVAISQQHGNRGGLTITVDEGQPLRLSEIQVLKAGPLSDAEIRGELGVRPGDRLTRDAAFAGLDRLETVMSEKGYLNSRISQAFILPDGSRQTSYSALAAAKSTHVAIGIAVEPGQLATVMVEGDVLLPTTELAKAITVYKNRSYSPSELEFSAAALRDLYVANGYAEATVSPTIARQKDDSYLITFHIDARQRVTVKAVEFEGNHAYTGDQLRRLLVTQPPRAVFGGGAFVPGTWEADMANLVAWYEAQGFAEAKVTAVDRLLDSESGQLTLVVHVDEGPRTMIARLLFKGASPAQESGLLQAVPINPGSAYNPQRMGDYIASVEAYYAKEGYPIARVAGEFQPGATPAQGTLVFTVSPGPRKRIGNIILRGNINTQDWVVRRQLTVEPGSYYNSEALLLTQQQIYQLGFFDRVNIGPLRAITADPKDPIDLIIDMHERATGSLALGGGFGDMQGAQASGEYVQTNLAGTGRPIRLEGLLSGGRSSVVTSLRDPYLFGADNIGELGASYLLESPTKTLDVETYGPTVGISRQLTEHLLASARYSWSRSHYRDASEAERLQAGALADRINSIITTGLTFDSRSDILNPRWGARTELSVDLATPLLGGSITYARPRLSWAYFWPFPRQITLALGAELGYIGTLGTAGAPPTDLLYRAGGGNSIRGFGYNAIGVNGTTEGGQALLVSRAELRFPIVGDFGGVVFTDAGNVWADPRQLTTSNLKLASGLGIRYLTPVGPVRLDYAFRVWPALDFGFGGKIEDLIGQHFYFGIGQAF